MDVFISLPYPRLEYRLQEYGVIVTTIDETISHKFEKSISIATLPPSLPTNNHKYINIYIRLDMGPTLTPIVYAIPNDLNTP